MEINDKLQEGKINIVCRESKGSGGTDYIIEFMQNDLKVYSQTFHISYDEREKGDNPKKWAVRDFINKISHKGYSCMMRGSEIEIKKIESD